jgi:hypothetical protein
LPTGTKASRAHARRSIDEPRRRPNRPNLPAACIHTLCARPPPAIPPTRASHRSHCRHRWAGVVSRPPRNTSGFPGLERPKPSGESTANNEYLTLPGYH